MVIELQVHTYIRCEKRRTDDTYHRQNRVMILQGFDLNTMPLIGEICREIWRSWSEPPSR